MCYPKQSSELYKKEIDGLMGEIKQFFIVVNDFCHLSVINKYR